MGPGQSGEGTVEKGSHKSIKYFKGMSEDGVTLFSVSQQAA